MARVWGSGFATQKCDLLLQPSVLEVRIFSSLCNIFNTSENTPAQPLLLEMAKLGPKGDCVQLWLKDPWQGWSEHNSQVEVGEGQDWSNQERFQKGLGEGQPWLPGRKRPPLAWWIQEGFLEDVTPT